MSNDLTKGQGTGVAVVSAGTSRFLERAREAKNSLVPQRVIFGFDATASRQYTWNAAIPMQQQLLDGFLSLGATPPQVRLTYFRGHSEFKASEWMNNGTSIK